jgi:hypothetical protein
VAFQFFFGVVFVNDRGHCYEGT